ncbi:hypothetical protein USDA257_p00490 (plasmid) [Sinorhizobium fredii USDA 257]|uniref:Uncharacterized protein n=1 Tax=Sinorhizobium fredii (strain USDA 257) TaxID=1185652 RepID=I3XFW1_SINF2|nr:hypothetical protein USDA257_p00490 [Sinorhizobium fredii USDA 257]
MNSRGGAIRMLAAEGNSSGCVAQNEAVQPPRSYDTVS